MPTILRAPDRLTAAQRKTTTTLYLAGPFDDDHGDSWRDEVIRITFLQLAAVSSATT